MAGIIAGLLISGCEPIVTDEPLKNIAKSSGCSDSNISNKGKPIQGYAEGMAIVFAKSYCSMRANKPYALALAKGRDLPESSADKYDALSWYNSNFRSVGLSNDKAGVETLKNLYMLGMGLGMRESDGKYCTGRDTTASNTTSDTAEAGLFQTSWNAMSAHPELRKLFDAYKAGEKCHLDIFKQGVTEKYCAAQGGVYGSGDGKEFQVLARNCPAFATEFAMLTLRTLRRHYGPINRKEAGLPMKCRDMFSSVQAEIDRNPELCGIL